MNKKKRELEQNELADALGSKYENVKQYVPKIIMFSTVILLGILAFAFYKYSSKKVNESQWGSFLAASRTNDPRNMSVVAEEFPNTTVGQMAEIAASDFEFGTGSVGIMTKRDDYKIKIKKAAERYTAVLENKKLMPFAKLRATNALAYAREAQGNFAEAKSLYQNVIDEAPDSPEGKTAAKSLARISDPSIVAIHAAFESWQPPKVAPAARIPLSPRPNIAMPTEDEFMGGGEESPRGLPPTEDGGGEAATVDGQPNEEPKNEEPKKEEMPNEEKSGDEEKSGEAEKTSSDDGPAAEKSKSEEPAAEKPSTEEPKKESNEEESGSGG